MSNRKTNLVLIGMPGSGKSTVGVLLAKKTARDFVDTDLLIQTAEHQSLQKIVDQDGYLALREAEERVLLALRARDHVIATGGSAVYSERAMHHLKRDGIAVYLNVDLKILLERIGDPATRGIARRPDQSFADLFRERAGLYARYADVTIPCGAHTQEEICDEIAGLIATAEMNSQ